MLGLSPLHPSGADQKVYIPEGYHNGNGYVKTNSVYGLSEKTVTIPEGYHNGSGYVTVKALSDIDVTSQVTNWTITTFEGYEYVEGPNGKPIRLPITTRTPYYGIASGPANAKYIFTINEGYASYNAGDGTVITYNANTVTIQANSNGAASVKYKPISKAVRTFS